MDSLAYECYNGVDPDADIGQRVLRDILDNYFVLSG